MSLTLLISLMGCSKPIKTVEKHAITSIDDYPTLVDNTDVKLRVKVEDALTSKNSIDVSQDDGLNSDFVSVRKITIIDEFGTGIVLDSIFHSEAIINNTYYRYEGLRTLEKDDEYLLYLVYSDVLDGYIVSNFTGAIVPLGTDLFENTNPQVLLSDFVSLLSLDSSMDEEELKRYGAAEYRPGILEFSYKKNYETKINEHVMHYYISELDSDHEILEINNFQYKMAR